MNILETNDPISEKLRKWRTWHKLNQAQMTDALGVYLRRYTGEWLAVSTLSNWERGKFTPKPYVLQALHELDRQYRVMEGANDIPS